MTEQQQHLANLLEQRDALKSDLEKLQETTGNRRELFFKVQGAIEYLQQTGVTLPEPESQEEAEVAETEVVEEELPTSKKKA
jgi:hypothetical protein